MYEPVNVIRVDRTPPVAVIDRLALRTGQLQGLALIEPGARVIAIRDGELIKGTRNFTPRADAISAQPRGTRPPGTVVLRFVVSVGSDPSGVRLFAQDKAGNRTELDAVIVT